ncbi:MAG: AMP-binding protein [Gammaproteobacteria bacterium]|nr:AMP-binding protein [Gammaproteobacteria bacterium]
MAEHSSSITTNELLQLVQSLVKEVRPNLPASLIVTLDNTFDKDLGLDSLARVELIARVETRYNLALPESSFAEAETTRDLMHAILKAKSSLNISSISHQINDFQPTELGHAVSIPTQAKTLIDVLDWHVEHHANRKHIQFLQQQGNDQSITYLNLKQAARNVAAGLQAQGLLNAEAVAIMLPTGLDYFYCYYGILMAGGIPVPIYPPARPSQLEDHMRRHSKILINCGASLLITVEEAKRVAKLLKSQAPNLKRILTVDELNIAGKDPVTPLIKESDTAFIQYTSGSTGQPKGVVLSHANLLANIRAMGEVVQAGPDDVFVSWLPLYHDMGLIGAWLGSLYFASLFVVMSPLSFLAHPEYWLRAIHRYRGTLSASPNFGYEFCLRRLNDEQLQGLDLSSWRAAFNGAEAVSTETLANFSARFASYGFQAKAMMPVYGLAESSVGLAFPPINRGVKIDCIDRSIFTRNGLAKTVSEEDDLAFKFPSSGSPIPGHQVRIVDQAGHELPERKEGKVQFHGPSSTSGYFRNAEKTRQLFVEDWLDSGDLGYIAEGEIYITGRIKDIIIRAGRNIYPEELEEAIGNVEGIRTGRVAIFGSEDQESRTERLIILAETRAEEHQERESLRVKINTLATDLAGSPPDDVVLAPPGSILKTSSGKIRRAASRELYESGQIGKTVSSVPWQIIRLSISGFAPQMRRSIQYFKDLAFAGYGWSMFAVLAPVVWLSALFLPKFEYRWSIMCASARAFAKLTGTAVTINGADKLKADKRSFIFVANHSSYLDVYALVARLPGYFRFIAKSELAENFVTRKPLQNINTEFVERYDITKSVTETEHLADVLKSGESLFFFAEGTFSRIPGLMPFHLGAFMLAAESGVPIIPVAIRGTRSMLRSGSWFPHHGSIHLEIGEPVDPKKINQEMNEDSWNMAINLRDRCREYILRHCGEPDIS